MKNKKKSTKATLHKSTMKNLSKFTYGGKLTNNCPWSTEVCFKIKMATFRWGCDNASIYDCKW